MNREKIVYAIGEIDFDMVLDSDEHFKGAKQSEKVARVSSFLATKSIKRGNNMKKILTFAACFCLFIAAVFFIYPKDGNNGGGTDNQTPDQLYAAWFNGYLYEPISQLEHEIFPALSGIYEKTVTGYRYNINEEHIGEYIGIFPAIEHLDLSEGRAYHYSAYPDYDSIIIVERGSEYSFYIAHAGILPEGASCDSTTMLYYYGNPSEIRLYNTDESVISITGEELELVLSMLDGKELSSYNTTEKVVFDAWYRENGDVGVSFENGKVSYDNPEIREMYTEFETQGTKDLWMNTEKGFSDIYIYYNPRFKYFAINHYYYYFLTDAEVEVISSVIGS